MKENKNELNSNDEVQKDTQPNTGDDINQPISCENSSEQESKKKEFSFNDISELLKNFSCDESNDGLYLPGDNIMKNEGKNNSKQKICIKKNFMRNKRSKVNSIERKKNKNCKKIFRIKKKNVNSNKYKNKKLFSKEDNNYLDSNNIPLNENENYYNSKYNNNNSNFLLFENQSSNNNYDDINFSSLEQNNINQISEFITSHETYNLQQNNNIQNLQEIIRLFKLNYIELNVSNINLDNSNNYNENEDNKLYRNYSNINLIASKNNLDNNNNCNEKEVINYFPNYLNFNFDSDNNLDFDNNNNYNEIENNKNFLNYLNINKHEKS